jgi:hypothetical protein
MMKIRLIIATLILCLISMSDANGQVRKRTIKKKKEKETQEEAVPLLQKLSADIRVGNISISQGFQFSIKPSIGYNVNKYLAGGLGSRLYLDYFNFGGQEATYVDYGGFAFARLKIQGFYLQGEYARTKFEFDNVTINYPLAGLGYVSGNGNKWKYGVELMLPLSKDARTYGRSLEYWINFTYNY